MEEIDEHLKNLKDSVEKIRNLESENSKDKAEKPRNMQCESSQEMFEKPRSPQNQSFKDMIQKLRNLQAERKSLITEIDELKELAAAKATDLENEVAALRDEIKSLKILMNMSEPDPEKRTAPAFKGNHR